MHHIIVLTMYAVIFHIVVELYPSGEHNALRLSWVNFTCSGTGNDLYWIVDNKILVDEELESRDITVHQHSTPAGNVSSTLVSICVEIWELQFYQMFNATC